MTRLLPLILAALLAATAAPAPAAPPGPIEIRDHRGGNVLRAIERRAQLERSGRPVRITGYCRSACTIYLSLPNACLGPQARVGFHAPRIEGTDIIPPYIDLLLGQFYRGKVREKWFGGWNRSRKMQVLSAREYRRLDPQMRLCR